jgi:tyrosinase
LDICDNVGIMFVAYYLHVILLTVSFTTVTSLPQRQSIILPNTCQDMQHRLEIRDLERNVDQWNVFLLGMKRMKELNYTDPLSYYQLAGTIRYGSVFGSP